MRAVSRRMVLWMATLAFLCLGFISARGEELIEPTRTVEGSQEATGMITVFSEPPELDVYLDNAEIGRTPIWKKKIPAGTHNLRIKDTEKAFLIQPGQYLKIGLFKASLIELPQEEQKASEKAAPQEIEKAKGSPSPAESMENERKRDLTLWERFVNRSLRHF